MEVLLPVAILGCGARQAAAPAAGAQAPDAEAAFAPLEVGADYRTAFTKLNKAPWVSKTHGNRWVNVYANALAADPYRAARAEFPVGAIVVKESFENENGQPGAPGPVFVMEKRAAGYAPDHGDWWYAIHWENPSGPAARFGKIYWRGKSPRAGYCSECHDAFDGRGSMGGIPPANRAY